MAKVYLMVEDLDPGEGHRQDSVAIAWAVEWGEPDGQKPDALTTAQLTVEQFVSVLTAMKEKSERQQRDAAFSVPDKKIII